MKTKIIFLSTFLAFTLQLFSLTSYAASLVSGDAAPVFRAKTQANGDFDMASRRGTWTVLYFYPKAETPGCTKQACAFRDNIDKIQKEGAEVFGVSANSVADQAEFYKNHHLNFTLLADPQSEIINLYGSKMLGLNMSRRWTFIIGPDLKIKKIDKDVDPAMDAEHVAKSIAHLKTQLQLEK